MEHIEIQNTDEAREALRLYEEAQAEYDHIRWQTAAGAGKYFLAGGNSIPEDLAQSQPFVDEAKEKARLAWIALQPHRWEFRGWGIVGEPQDGALVPYTNNFGYNEPTLDVRGYHAEDYWDGDTFKGPDIFGIVPVYVKPDGEQFPAEAKVFPYLA